jgi:putative ABC transport system permease protein
VKTRRTISLAWRNLIYGGQRSLFAGLCISFGVMAVVSMSLLSKAIREVLILDARYMLGGDVNMMRSAEDYIDPQHLALVEAWKEDGTIQAYTAVALNRYLTFKIEGSPMLYFAAEGLGIDPHSYPLVGVLEIEGGQLPAELLQTAEDILMTRDLVQEFNLAVGQRIIIADLSMGSPVPTVLRGVVSDTPDHQGGKIYYGYDTAQTLSGTPTVLNRVYALTHDLSAASEIAYISGWYPLTTEYLSENNRQAGELFDIGLNGAGILGLLVGGIGVANTMQVLLRRRLQDAAILKVLGYTERDLQGLFLTEGLILGILGSAVGLALGIGVSIYLVSVFNQLANLLVTWIIAPEPLAAGLITGTGTCLLFSWIAVLSTSRVQPAALLRREPLRINTLGRMRLGGLVLVLTLLFTGLAALVMGSLIKAASIVLFAYGGLVVLGGGMATVGWMGLRLLPLGRFPLVNLVRRRILRYGAWQVFSMIALFTGVTSLGLASVVTGSAQREYDLRRPELEGYDLILRGPSSQIEALIMTAESLKHRRKALGSEASKATPEVLQDLMAASHHC